MTRQLAWYQIKKKIVLPARVEWLETFDDHSFLIKSACGKMLEFGNYPQKTIKLQAHLLDSFDIYPVVYVTSDQFSSSPQLAPSSLLFLLSYFSFFLLLPGPIQENLGI